MSMPKEAKEALVEQMKDHHLCLAEFVCENLHFCLTHDLEMDKERMLEALNKMDNLRVKMYILEEEIRNEK